LTGTHRWPTIQLVSEEITIMQRRTMLQSALAVLAWRPSGRQASAQTGFGDAHRTRVAALAAAVLPQELGADGQRRAIDQFMSWVRDYRAGAERDHGYGVPAIRTTPASPAGNYLAQLDDLDRRAGGSFVAASLADRQRIATDAIAAANVRDLPGRPNGGHLATDLMSHYFNSPAANDLAYGRLIGRDACRDLKGSDARPAELPAMGKR
jgi:hypothetical protein